MLSGSASVSLGRGTSTAKSHACSRESPALRNEHPKLVRAHNKSSVLVCCLGLPAESFGSMKRPLYTLENWRMVLRTSMNF